MTPYQTSHPSPHKQTILIEKADTLDEGLRGVFDVIDNGGHNQLTRTQFVQVSHAYWMHLNSNMLHF